MTSKLSYKMLSTLLGAFLAFIAILGTLSGWLENEVGTLTEASVFIASAALLSSGLGMTSSAIEIMWGFVAAELGVKVVEPLEVLGDVGSVFLFFMLGIEMRLEAIRRVVRSALVPSAIVYTVSFFGILTFLSFASLGTVEAIAVSFVLSSGNAVMTHALVKHVGYDRIDTGFALTASSLTMQAISIAGVTVLSLHRVSSVIASMGLGIAVVFILFLPKLARYVIASLPTREETEAELRIIIVTLLVLALISENLKLNASLMAFVLGMALSESVRAAGIIESKLKGITSGFLAPIFFFMVGLRYRFPTTLEGAFLVAVLTAIVALSKTMLFKGIMKCVKGKLVEGKLTLSLLANISVVALLADLLANSGIMGSHTYVAVLTSSLMMSVAASIVLRAKH